MSYSVRQIEVADAAGFRECLNAVASERKYLAQTEALPAERVAEFVAQSVQSNAAQYVAVADGQVVGWCDVFPHWATAIKHVGTLGMGVHPAYRGRGIGRALLVKTLEHALRQGVYRVVLEAREDNKRAIALYEKLGFKHEARTACALCFDGVFYAGIQMALLQGPASAA